MPLRNPSQSLYHRLLVICERRAAHKNPIAQVVQVVYSEVVLRNNDTFTGTPQDFLDAYSPDTEIGKRLRQRDAAQMLERIRQMESETRQREQVARDCVDRIQQMNEAHRLNMDYLLQFGVWATHRQQLLQILETAEQHGQMTLREAVELANAKVHTQQQLNGLDQSSNGLLPAESSAS